MSFYSNFTVVCFWVLGWQWSSLVLTIAWHRIGDKPSLEPMMTPFSDAHILYASLGYSEFKAFSDAHICVTGLQWVQGVLRCTYIICVTGLQWVQGVLRCTYMRHWATVSSRRSPMHIYASLGYSEFKAFSDAHICVTGLQWVQGVLRCTYMRHWATVSSRRSPMHIYASLGYSEFKAFSDAHICVTGLQWVQGVLRCTYMRHWATVSSRRSPMHIYASLMLGYSEFKALSDAHICVTGLLWVQGGLRCTYMRHWATVSSRRSPMHIYASLGYCEFKAVYLLANKQ